MRARHALFALLSLLPASAGAETVVHGRVFYPPLDPVHPAFLFEGKVAEKDGKTHDSTTYTSPDGKTLITEEVDLTGDKLVRYSYRQEQVHESGEATFENGHIQMSFTEAGKTSHDSEDYDPATVVAPMIRPLLDKRWDDLMKGDTVRVRYLAIERLETIGFKFFKDGERTLNGREVVDIKMKPSSFIIAALVDPIRITMTKTAPHRIVETNGRTPIRVPKRNPPEKRSDWRAIDARVEYDLPK